MPAKSKHYGNYGDYVEQSVYTILYKGPLSWDNCHWTVVMGQLSLDSCHWTVVMGQLSLESCHWTVFMGQLSLDSCHGTIAMGHLFIDICLQRVRYLTYIILMYIFYHN